MPPLAPSKQLRGVTYHTDGLWYAVGFDTANTSLSWIMRSTDSTGNTWENYSPTGDSLTSELNSINSIGNRLVISGRSAQYQIISNVVTKYDTPNYTWRDNVKDANSNGFDMAGQTITSVVGAFSKF
jgi:hypothetical protein